MGLESTMAHSQTEGNGKGVGTRPHVGWGWGREALYSFGKCGLEARGFLGNQGTAPPQGIVGILEAERGRRGEEQQQPPGSSHPAQLSTLQLEWGPEKTKMGRGAPQPPGASAGPCRLLRLFFLQSQVLSLGQKPGFPGSPHFLPCLGSTQARPPACQQHSVNLAQLSGPWLPRPGTRPTQLREAKKGGNPGADQHV